MADFTGLGQGFAAGTNAGVARSANIRNNRTNLQLQERQQQQQAYRDAFQTHLGNLEGNYDQIQGLAETALSQPAADRKAALRMMLTAVEVANETANRMAKVFPEFDPTLYKQRGRTILEAFAISPTAEQTKKAEAKAKAAGDIAAAGAYAPYVGDEAARLTLPGAKDKATLDVSRRGVAVSEAQQREPDISNFRFPDGRMEGVNLSSPDAAIKVQQVLANGAVKVGLNVQAPGVGGLDLPKSTTGDFLESQVASLNAIDMGDRLLEMLPEGDVLTGWASGVVRGLSSLAGNVAQLAKTAGGTVEGLESEIELLDPNKYDLSAFGDKSSRSAAFRTNIINYAYAVARGREPGGRLSAQDVQSAIDSLAASSGDKAQITASIAEIQREVKVNYNNRRATVESFSGQTLPKIPERLAIKEDEGASAIEKLIEMEDIPAAEWGKLSDDEKRKVLQGKGLM